MPKKSITRRATLTAAAAAAFGATTILPAPAAEADPIFAAIEAHRKAIKAWDAALRLEQNHPSLMARSKAIKAWLSQDDRQDEDYPGPDEGKPQDLLDAEAHANALGDLEMAAQDDLVATTPTTLPGALAAIRYVLSYYEGESELYPDQSHDLLDDDAFLSFVGGIGDAIEESLQVTQKAAL